MIRDSANPGQTDAFPNLFMAPRQGSQGTSIDIHACIMPSPCRFHFHRGNSGKGGGGREGNTVRASRAKIASSLGVDARACAAYARLTATCKTCKVISRAELRRRQRRTRDAAFSHTGFTVPVLTFHLPDVKSLLSFSQVST